MPLTLAEFNVPYTIHKICGNEKQRHHIEALGFVEGTTIQVLSKFSEYYIVLVKGSKIGMDKDVAKRIIIVSE